jgi:hypothetical protein
MTKRFLSIALLIIFLFQGLIQVKSQEALKKWFPGHYAKTGSNAKMGIEEGSIELIKNNPYFVGYTTNVFWNEIEVSRDVYDFSKIYELIRVADRDNKKLMLTLKDVVHSGGGNPYLPQYILSDEYEGGYFSVTKPGDSGTGTLKSFARWWLPQYRERWEKYIRAVGKEFDNHPTIAVINFCESARPEPDEPGTGYSAENMIKFFKGQNTAAAEAFPNTVVIQYLNWMVISEEDRDEFMEYLVDDLKVGFGGPDIKNFSRGSEVLVTNRFSRYYLVYREKIPISVEAQSGAFRGGSAREIFHYAVDSVKVNFLPWTTSVRDSKNGFSFYDVIKVVNEEKGRVNADLPVYLKKEY